MRRALLVAGIAGALALAPGAPAAPAGTPSQLLPVDEAARHPDFFSFRATLQSAIARRDTATLLAAVDPHVQTSFGDGGGIDEFVATWRPSDPESRLWDELGTILALGGSFQDSSTFAAPYPFSRWPEQLDAFGHVVITGSKVRVREAPHADAPVLAQVDFAILPLVATDTTAVAGWTPVRLGDARTGYVASRLARSPVGWRAIFQRKGVTWHLMALVAGD